jgi:hypothetical protein
MMKQQKDGLGRREFLVLASSTAVAAIAFGDELLLPRAAAATPRRVALGYAGLDAPDTSGPNFLSSNVGSALSAASGDGSLISSGTRVSVLGGHFTKGKSPAHVDLVAKFSVWVNGVRQELPFYAWSYDGVHGMKSSPVTFTVPMAATQRLSLSLLFPAAPISTAVREIAARAGLSAGPGEEEVPVVLSIASEKGSAAGLRRGFYVLAPLSDGAAEPDWQSYQLRMEGGPRLVDVRGRTPVDAQFDYIILRIDAAPERIRNDRPAEGGSRTPLTD